MIAQRSLNGWGKEAKQWHHTLHFVQTENAFIPVQPQPAIDLDELPAGGLAAAPVRPGHTKHREGQPCVQGPKVYLTSNLYLFIFLKWWGVLLDLPSLFGLVTAIRNKSEGKYNILSYHQIRKRNVNLPMVTHYVMDVKYTFPDYSILQFILNTGITEKAHFTQNKQYFPGPKWQILFCQLFYKVPICLIQCRKMQDIMWIHPIHSFAFYFFYVWKKLFLEN